MMLLCSRVFHHRRMNGNAITSARVTLKWVLGIAIKIESSNVPHKS